MLINTFLDTEDFVHLYYEDEPSQPQGCGAGARMASKLTQRPPSPDYSEVATPSTGDMTDGRERCRAPPPPEPPPLRVRAADLYPRLRVHYDEPDLEIGFTPICGEFVQWVGRTTDGGTVAMSNYRLHVHPRRRNGAGVSVPLRLIDTVEIRDLLHLVVLCKHGRQLKCTFTNGNQCVEWWQRLNTALAPIGSVQETFAAAYAAWAKEQPPTSVHRALLKESHSQHKHWFGSEVERLGFTTKGAWRVTAANAEHKLCPSYPPLLIVPASIGDEDLESVARFRAMRRVPAVVWRHRGNGAVIARSSQPEVGWLGWRNPEDEFLLGAYVSACNADRGMQNATSNKNMKLLIVDARSYASAVTNRARGGGCECQQYYPAADIQFMNMPNIHHVRRSFQNMRALAAEPSDQNNWHSNLERTLWLHYVSGVCRASCVVARAVLAGRPVLVHCSDGWDRTPQIVAGAQLILDPYYRTVEGFRVLIEREWLDFGHKFADRCGHTFGPEDPNERSPIFLQWLDAVHQMMLQYPCSFEFNEAYLIKLATHVHSCMFGTFLCNTGRERSDSRVADYTAHVWHLLRAPAYRNHLYSPHQPDQVVWPEYGVRYMRVWWAMFAGEPKADTDLPAPPNVARDPPHNGLMTKTRSCDNLLNEAEKRTTQRRCSDPSIAPDVMKLVVTSSRPRSRSSRTALTDSCVDELPALPINSDNSDNDQVDGLHPDHFESSPRLPRDIASGSSSLERELAPNDKVISHDTESDSPADTDNDMAASVIRIGASPETSEEQPVFVCDAYGDVIGMAEPPRHDGRQRNISITWRSISESSNQSSNGFDIPDQPQSNCKAIVTSHESSPIDNQTTQDNHNSTEGDITNHNVTDDAVIDPAVVEPSVSDPPRLSNGDAHVNGVDETAAKFLETELNGGATSSSISSESEGEASASRRPHPLPHPHPHSSHHGPRTRQASQLTLCPASPRRIACCHCSRRASATSGIETSGESIASSEVCWCGVCGGEVGSERVRCVCGAPGKGPGVGAMPDPCDGLPPAADALQARLHQIILSQKKVVEELTGQLREAREALRRATPPAVAASSAARPSPSAPSPTTMRSSSGSGRSATRSGSATSGSSSGSASEVEVGEEARGVVWLPDAAAPRCQHCRNNFWLARRRHHCRRCGGIFCGSCSEMSSWGDCGSVRMCRRCRALR